MNINPSVLPTFTSVCVCTLKTGPLHDLNRMNFVSVYDHVVLAGRKEYEAAVVQKVFPLSSGR